MKSKLIIFIIAVLIIIPLTVLGCKTQDRTELEEKIAELEGELTEEETEVVEEEMPEVMEEETQEEAEEEAPVDEEEAQGDAEEEAEEEASDDVDKEGSTISLAIYEGPTLDGSICYYIVKATVDGNPSPSVSFSKDDSGGAWGSKKVQINLNDPADTYTLTATATNSEGSDTDSIALTWRCEVPEPGPIEMDVDIIADKYLSGLIIRDRFAINDEIDVIVGDSTNNKTIKAYLSFNIDDLVDIDGLTIKNVSVSIPIDDIHNHPELAGSELYIKVYDYGDSLELADQGLGGKLVKTMSTSASLTNLDFSSNKLEDELQKAVDVDKQWFQLKISLGGISANNITDQYSILIGVVVLHITYEVSDPWIILPEVVVPVKK